jgi:hypothetical protein
LNGTERTIALGGLGLLGINLVVGVVLTLPRLWGEQSLAAQAALLEGEVAREKGIVAAQKHRAAIAEANARDADALYHRTFKGPKRSLVPILEELDRVTQESGLKRGAESFVPAAVKGVPLLRVGIRAPFTGSYEEIVDFLTRVERSELFFVVDHVQLTSRNPDSQDLAIELSTYFVSEGK